MKKLQDIRAENFKRLLEEFGSQRDLSEKVGFSVSYISQLNKGHRSIGEKTARKIEQAASKPALWLDQSSAASPACEEVIERVRHFPEEHLPVLLAFLDSISSLNKKNR